MLLRNTFSCIIATLLSAIQAAMILVSTPEITSHLTLEKKNQISLIKSKKKKIKKSKTVYKVVKYKLCLFEG